jgi:hypothetical protein
MGFYRAHDRIGIERIFDQGGRPRFSAADTIIGSEDIVPGLSIARLKRAMT